MQPKRAFIPGIVIVLVALTAVWAHAQGQIQLTSVAEVEVERFNQEGKKEVQRVKATKVLPGNEVIFTTLYENTGKEAAENAVITNPMPEHMIYTQNSARGMGTMITFSVDGGKTYDAPAKLFIFDASGRKFPARPQDYTHIRWSFGDPLPPGAKGEVSFRAILQ